MAYMKHMKDVFLQSFDQSFGDFESYLIHMGEDGSYGDDCCLQCAAHLLLPRIKIICANPEHDREFLPPESVSPDVWGDDLYLAFVAWNHFEATARVVQQQDG